MFNQSVCLGRGGWLGRGQRMPGLEHKHIEGRDTATHLPLHPLQVAWPQQVLNKCLWNAPSFKHTNLIPFIV